MKRWVLLFVLFWIFSIVSFSLVVLRLRTFVFVQLSIKWIGLDTQSQSRRLRMEAMLMLTSFHCPSVLPPAAPLAPPTGTALSRRTTFCTNQQSTNQRAASPPLWSPNSRLGGELRLHFLSPHTLPSHCCHCQEVDSRTWTTKPFRTKRGVSCFRVETSARPTRYPTSEAPLFTNAFSNSLQRDDCSPRV